MNQLSWWFIMIPWAFVAVVLILSTTFSVLFLSALLIITRNKWYFTRSTIPFLTGLLTCAVLISVIFHMKYTDVPKNWFSRLPVQESQYMQRAILRQKSPMTMTEYSNLHDHFEKASRNQIITRQQQLRWAGLPQQPATAHPES